MRAMTGRAGGNTLLQGVGHHRSRIVGRPQRSTRATQPENHDGQDGQPMGESRMLRSCRDHAADYRLQYRANRRCGGMSPSADIHDRFNPTVLNRSRYIKHLLLAAGQQADSCPPAKLQRRDIVPHT